jgi:hypothetical protein
MSKCNVCIYSLFQYKDLCNNIEEKLLGGAQCKQFYPQKTTYIEKCLLCSGINDQSHRGKQYCSCCEEKFASKC